MDRQSFGELETLACNLRVTRAALGISQHELAVRSGLARAYTSRIERGLANPTVTVLARLAVTLGATVGDLLTPVALIPPDRKHESRTSRID